MKIFLALLLVLVVIPLCLLSGCASQAKSKAQAPDTAMAEAPAQPSETAPSAEGSEPALTAEEENLFKDEWDTAEEQGPQETYKIPDPIEPFNRVMFQFNDKLYEWLMRPLSLGYRKVTPQNVRTGVQNFFTNLAAPARMVSCILQGKGRAATTEVGKFMINSTFGILGFMDLFKGHPDLYPDAEDLGQTLAVYGVGDGFYLVLPFLGPSSLRDAVGLAGDSYMDPVNYIKPVETAVGVKGLNAVNRLSFRIEDFDAAKRAAFDPYEAARNFYTQSRQNRIKR